MAQGHLIAHHLIFDGVLQWGIEKHLYGFPLYESHFDNALAEAAVTQHFDDNAALASL